MAQNELTQDELIARKIEGAPRLASLRSIGAALSELVYAENSFTSQIAEVIRRDPSLTSRLLKLVNSVFFGLSQRVNNIEEAIFYLGLRQIRELAMATPIIEDFERLHGNAFKNAPRIGTAPQCPPVGSRMTAAIWSSSFRVFSSNSTSFGLMATVFEAVASGTPGTERLS